VVRRTWRGIRRVTGKGRVTSQVSSKTRVGLVPSLQRTPRTAWPSVNGAIGSDADLRQVPVFRNFLDPNKQDDSGRIFFLPCHGGCGRLFLHLPLDVTVGKARHGVSHLVPCREGKHEATAYQDGRASEPDQYRRNGGPQSPGVGGVTRRQPSEKRDDSVALPLTDLPSAPRVLRGVTRRGGPAPQPDLSGRRVEWGRGAGDASPKIFCGETQTCSSSVFVVTLSCERPSCILHGPYATRSHGRRPVQPAIAR
jgi:hypothetical protein